MPRVKKLSQLFIVLLLVSLSLVYLLHVYLQNYREGEELQELNKQAFQLLKEINDNRQWKKKDQHLALLGNLKPEYVGGRGISSHEYKLTDKLKLMNNIQEHVKLTQKPAALLKDNSLAKKSNRTKRNFSFTEFIKTEVEEKKRRYLKTLSNSPKLLLGEVFNVETYLSPQHFTGGDTMKQFKFNHQASDNTPYNRTLWDMRDPKPKYELPNVDVHKLPNTSVIICFHNEARSALLRTVYSVLNHSPTHLLTEIILIDDFSKDGQDGELLTVIPKVKLIRLNKREGLIRARLIGVKTARAQVLTFLDSHCEVTRGWLEPLLTRIQQGSHHVVSPIIDIIRKDNMKYNQANTNIRGGFGHNLHFKWDNLNYQELQERRRDNTGPIKTPAIAGGLFSVDKAYFEYIGSYDEEMEIWGGENVEFSMRAWMCGGTLEIMPCSRVGHIFRSSMPYSFGNGKSYYSTVTRNLRRIAEVWMDDYKHFFYETNTAAKSIPYGNVSSRQELKKRLECKPFRWYIDNIYPEFIPNQQKDVVKMIGRLKQESTGCLQSQDPNNGVYKLVMKKCALESKDNAWSLTNKGHIKHQGLCLTIAKNNTQVNLWSCLMSNDSSQVFKWTRDNFIIKITHKASELCLATRKVEGGQSVLTLQTCTPNNTSQNWILIF